MEENANTAATGDRRSFSCFAIIGQDKEEERSYNCGQFRSNHETSSEMAEEKSRMTTTKLNYKNKTKLIHKLFHLILLNTALNQLNYITQQQTSLSTFLPKILLAEAIECTLDGDCNSGEKICHENRCICARDRPIEDQDRCLSLSLINEQCSLSEQCLGNSLCVDGICSCGNEAISLFNPSTKIYYCHPKRRLNEECNYDSQCPSNSYCSTKKYGCICQNGYSAATVKDNMGTDSEECLPKFCTNSSSCESEFHQCDESKCKCLATHFDPTTGKCYKFGSTGGKPLDELVDSGGQNNNTIEASHTEDKFYSYVKDLMENSDKMWLVLVILISLSILIFALIFMLIRRHYLGYCWTAHKKEYEPNNKSPAKNNNYFNKNSINNKSFRQKNGDVEDEEDNLAEDRSNLVISNKNNDKKKNGNSSRAPFMTNTKTIDNERNYVKVNINDNHHGTSDSATHYQHHQVDPLASSISTPV